MNVHIAYVHRYICAFIHSYIIIWMNACSSNICVVQMYFYVHICLHGKGDITLTIIIIQFM